VDTDSVYLNEITQALWRPQSEAAGAIVQVGPYLGPYLSPYLSPYLGPYLGPYLH